MSAPVVRLVGGGESFEPDAFEALLQEHAEVGQRYAAGWVDCGPGSLLDNKRKAYLSTIAARIRVQKAEKSEKITEAAIEEAAHADPDYVAWLLNTEAERLAFQLTQLEMDRIEAKLRHLELAMRRGL